MLFLFYLDFFQIHSSFLLILQSVLYYRQQNKCENHSTYVNSLINYKTFQLIDEIVQEKPYVKSPALF